jgi:hypothetical protein
LEVLLNDLPYLACSSLHDVVEPEIKENLSQARQQVQLDQFQICLSEQDERRAAVDIENQRVQIFHQSQPIEQDQLNECEKIPSPFQLMIEAQLQKLAERREQQKVCYIFS